MTEQSGEIARTLANELGRHAMARPGGEVTTWCVCLCWWVARASRRSDEWAYEQHVASAQAHRLTAERVGDTDA